MMKTTHAKGWMRRDHKMIFDRLIIIGFFFESYGIKPVIQKSFQSTYFCSVVFVGIVFYCIILLPPRWVGGIIGLFWPVCVRLSVCKLAIQLKKLRIDFRRLHTREELIKFWKIRVRVRIYIPLSALWDCTVLHLTRNKLDISQQSCIRANE